MKYRTTLAILLSIAIISFAWISGCGGGGNDDGGTGISVTNAEGGTYSLGQAQVTFPPSSVDRDIIVSGSTVSSSDMPSHLTPVSDRHRISLSDPDAYNADTATISITLSGSTEGVSIYHSSDGTEWNKLEGTVNGNIISAGIPHFSDFVAATESYTLKVNNNSFFSGTICIYQDNPNIGVSDVSSIAWLTEYVNPNSSTTFSWTENYSFHNSETSDLTPGLIFLSMQTLGANLSSTNKVTLTNSSGYCQFTNQTAGPSKGNLYIEQDNSVPSNQAAVGIGMYGRTTYAVMAQPDMTYTFTLNPKYWITHGDYTSGQVLDTNNISNKKEFVFPSGCYSMNAVLNNFDEWTISCTN
ncbi:MAG: hypothetical protein K8T10_09190 [Candidatus Eremiobacteraeota bacterium]|nr:hypothetical protein [Candidatus Eremiobacteraeota bacterium]